jgi:hypothetical protein
MTAISMVPRFDPRVITGNPNADLRRAFVYNDLNASNILIDTESATLTGIIDWEVAGILAEAFAARVPAVYDSPTVYSPATPLDPSNERFREVYAEMTQLRQIYCCDRCGLDGPDYYHALTQYDELNKLEECLVEDFGGLREEENIK